MPGNKPPSDNPDIILDCLDQVRGWAWAFCMSFEVVADSFFTRENPMKGRVGMDAIEELSLCGFIELLIEVLPDLFPDVLEFILVFHVFEFKAKIG